MTRFFIFRCWNAEIQLDSYIRVASRRTAWVYSLYGQLCSDTCRSAGWWGRVPKAVGQCTAWAQGPLTCGL